MLYLRVVNQVLALDILHPRVQLNLLDLLPLVGVVLDALLYLFLMTFASFTLDLRLNHFWHIVLILKIRHLA